MKTFLLGKAVIGLPLVLGTLNAQIDSGCENYPAWQMQSNPRSDATGINNHAYPEFNATYWETLLNYPLGTAVTITGQFPEARYVSFQAYDVNRNVLGSINDVQINPDFGQNNPYRGGTAQGTYTVHLVFGKQPFRGPAANTFYTSGQTNVGLIYRIYYSNNPEDLPGGPVNPVLPNVSVGGLHLASCPPRPILTPDDATLNGRLDDIDYIGTPPASKPKDTKPVWTFQITNPFTPYFPSQDNSYMSAFINRDFLTTPFNYDMFVIRMKTPTFDDTQAGVPPYAPANMRFWSMCQDEWMTTSVVRCVPDNRAATLNGFATFVISDPSKRPSDTVLSQWGANWIPWGAMEPGDVITDIDGNILTNANGVFYFGEVIYRQTMADPNFTQSILNISKLKSSKRQAAMGDYWPVIGYCTAAAFQASGAGCIGQ